MKTWLTPAASAEIGFLEGMEDLVATDEVLELSLGLTSENLLETSTTRLAHLQLRTGVHVTLQGIGATVVHLIGLHGDDR
mmetsp:Transcript_50872/g.122645  ORF Transcript_50872/g.122645 Transcript_50872/m.122645 type:complete len:80 (+) Transcript_50872:921-1160(+)